MDKDREETLIHTVYRIESYQKKWRNWVSAGCVFTVVLWTIFGTFIVSGMKDYTTTTANTAKNQAVIMNDITHIKSDIKDLKTFSFGKVTKVTKLLELPEG